VKTEWLRDKKASDQDAIEYALKNNPTLLQAFSDILDRYIAEEQRATESLVQYESPSWAYLQADRNGALRILKRIKGLFN
jgi:hypothetical protein